MAEEDEEGEEGRAEGDAIRGHLKKVFSPDIGDAFSSQVLDILEVACRRFIRPWRIPVTGGAG